MFDCEGHADAVPAAKVEGVVEAEKVPEPQAVHVRSAVVEAGDE